MAAWHGQVETRVWLTPGLVRVVLGGPGLSGLVAPDATDTYVNVAIPPAGAPYGPVFEPEAVRDEHPQELWPVRTTRPVSPGPPITMRTSPGVSHSRVPTCPCHAMK